MTNRKSTKRALLGSVMAMVLCMAMLVGATFAWFTDTASTGVNKIQAGNLDVALEMKDAAGQWVSAEGKTLDFVKAAAGEQVLWEPGCTYTLPELRVVNNGNLALKYMIKITGIKGDAKLNEAIDWTIGEDDGTPTLKSPDSPYLGKVTSVSNPAGTLPSSTQGVVTNAGYTMPYAIKVDLTNQVITIFSASEPGVYNVIEKQFICSTGTSSDPTPVGVYSLPDTERRAWRYFKTFDTYVRYAVHIKGNYFFHSLLYSEPDLDTMSTTSYRKLGTPASHGCIRMLDEDIKWMAENCLADTMVFIMDCEEDEALTQALKPPAL